MAFNSTPRRRFGVALGVVLTGVAAGLIGFAGTASAHTPNINAACKGETTTLNVKLTHYVANAKKKNSVKVLDGDKTLHEGDFRENFERKFETSGAVKHDFTVVVKAWDDPDGSKKWSFTKKLSVEACVTPTSSSTPPSSSEPSSTPPSSSSSETTPPSSSSETTPPSETTTSPTPTTTQPVVAPPVTTTTPAVVEEDDLAKTGASVGLPLGIGGVLLVGGVVLLFVVRRRSKA